MLGTLYVVATPVGNLGDITKRAVEILEKVDVILAEDTRVTNKLLAKFDIKTKTISYHAHSGENTKNRILKLLVEGSTLALVTDAGTPGISDPGNELIDWLLAKEPKIKVIPIPGPSAITTALSVCGFNVQNFEFFGFFPKKKRTKWFKRIASGKKVYVFFESPNRLLKTLGELKGHIGRERRLFVARELTKMYEETYRGDIEEILKKLKKSNPKGEVVVVVEKV